VCEEPVFYLVVPCPTEPLQDFSRAEPDRRLFPSPTSADIYDVDRAALSRASVDTLRTLPTSELRAATSSGGVVHKAPCVQGCPSKTLYDPFTTRATHTRSHTHPLLFAPLTNITSWYAHSLRLCPTDRR
jgi:hypothetical protein